jgi:hypothetical protein
MNYNIKIHVYCSGVSSYPNFSFNSALQKVVSQWSAKCSIFAETMTILNLRESGWTETQFVNWLLDCDIHFIVAHPHQGTETFQWSVCRLYRELNRLVKHIGFPSGKQLLCPIFTQNKFGYLGPLRGQKATNPTLKIFLRKEVDEYYLEWKTYLRFYKSF